MKHKAIHILLLVVSIVLFVGGTVMMFLEIEWGLLLALLGATWAITIVVGIYRVRGGRKPKSKRS